MAFLFHPILHAGHLVEAELRKGLTDIELQPRQARLLMALGQHQPVSQATLAASFAVSAASMSVMVVRLERDGLVQRHGENATFRTALSLTDHGRSLLPKVEAIWSAVDARLRTLLGDDQAEQLSRLSLALRDALGGAAPSEILNAEGDEL
jgi:DNA-binding MarR family transcriptional regulator